MFRLDEKTHFSFQVRSQEVISVGGAQIFRGEHNIIVSQKDIT